MVNEALDVLNRLLLQPFGVEKGQGAITTAIQGFLGANGDPVKAPKLHKRHSEEEVDDMRAILATLASESARKRGPFLVLLLKVLKVLLRKQSNRRALGRPGVQVVTALMTSADVVNMVSCECANVVLNMCYEAGNVIHFLEAGGIEALEPLIRSGDERLKARRDASGLGAIQSVCFEKPGRDATRNSGIIGAIVSLLEDGSPKVRARALGTVHNLSTDARSIGIIRKEGGLPRLVRLLRSHEAQVCGGAAGTIQNLSREEKSRALLLDTFAAVEPLADLLVGHHVKSQISAAGALVNIVGPDVTGSKRQLLHSVLTDGIVLGVIESCMA
ncbi:unnamed protein product [Scytosiphon promiscuus]